MIEIGWLKDGRIFLSISLYRRNKCLESKEMAWKKMKEWVVVWRREIFLACPLGSACENLIQQPQPELVRGRFAYLTGGSTTCLGRLPCRQAGFPRSKQIGLCGGSHKLLEWAVRLNWLRWFEGVRHSATLYQHSQKLPILDCPHGLHIHISPQVIWDDKEGRWTSPGDLVYKVVTVRQVETLCQWGIFLKGMFW